MNASESFLKYLNSQFLIFFYSPSARNEFFGEMQWADGRMDGHVLISRWGNATKTVLLIICHCTYVIAHMVSYATVSRLQQQQRLFDPNFFADSNRSLGRFILSAFAYAVSKYSRLMRIHPMFINLPTAWPFLSGLAISQPTSPTAFPFSSHAK